MWRQCRAHGWVGPEATAHRLRGEVAAMRTLLEFGHVRLNPLDSYGDTPLSLAASGGHLGAVEFLLGLDEIQINPLEPGRVSPFWRAVAGGHEAVVRLLLSLPSLQTNRCHSRWAEWPCASPLHAAAGVGHVETVRVILASKNADVNFCLQNHPCDTPLHVAIVMGSEEAVRVLLEDGRADVDRPNKQRITALEVAVEVGHKGIVRMLRLRNGRRVGVNTRGGLGDSERQTPG
ncbi:ankyrin [Tuber magnatum]|uniref:Ankyrin n=1 Tax=Tuber magnatum TaxID=42249 RepID=A0A317T3V7_9PEZI|nr:ankyrin [Tuber magnatum]